MNISTAEGDREEPKLFIHQPNASLDIWTDYHYPKAERVLLVRFQLVLQKETRLKLRFEYSDNFGTFSPSSENTRCREDSTDEKTYILILWKHLSRSGGG